jgi:hypothetical protein
VSGKREERRKHAEGREGWEKDLEDKEKRKGRLKEIRKEAVRKQSYRQQFISIPYLYC